jgi:hypothetical protein
VQLEGDDGSRSLFSVLEQPIGKYNCHMIWFDFYVLTPLSKIFQLYRGDQF